MNKQERYRKAREIFFAALNQPLQERARFLQRVCGSDQSLFQEAIELLATDEESNPYFDALEAYVGQQMLPALHDHDKPEKFEKLLTDNDSNAFSLVQLMGETIDRKYLIEHQLGSGGMGAVYVATHLHTKRQVAIKVITPEFADNPEFVERFRREAEAAGRLRHPNVVNVTDFGVALFNGKSLPYLVMEYLGGMTLKRLLQQQRKLSLSLTVDLLDQICLAIGKAHELGIVHRDVKPENIWLEPTGRGGYHVKVLDFGIAKLGDQITGRIKAIQNPFPQSVLVIPATAATLKCDSQEDEAVTMAQKTIPTGENQPGQTCGAELTRVGTVMGTPFYMSPEQCSGKPATFRSDLYSLGVMAYEMLAGEPPFKGTMPEMNIHHREHEPPALHQKCPELPRSVCQAVHQALAKIPEQRPASAAALAALVRTQAEGFRHLEHEAKLFVQSHSSELWQLSGWVKAPFLTAAALILTILLIGFPVAIPFEPIGLLFLWAIPPALLLLANHFGTTAHVLAVSYLQEHPTEQLPIKELRRKIWHHMTDLCQTSLTAWCLTVWQTLSRTGHLVDGLLAAPTNVLESVGPYRAFQLSQKHLSPFRPIARWIQWKRVQTTGLATLIATVVTLGFLEVLKFNGLHNRAGLLFFGFLGSAISFGILLRRYLADTDTAAALLYSKSLAAQGDSQWVSERISSAPIPTGWSPQIPLFLKVRTGLTAFCLTVALLFTYVLGVPPTGPQPQSQFTIYPVVPKEQNAWEEYRTALRKLEATFPSTEVFPSKLAEYGQWKRDDLVTIDNIFLDEGLQAAFHLAEGAKRPFAQFANPNNPQAETPPFQGVRNLVTYTTCEARRQFHLGNQRKAVELGLAAYHFTIDLEEPSAPYLNHLLGFNTRPIVNRFLFGLLSREDLEPALYQEIANRLAAEDTRLPTPAQIGVRQTQLANMELAYMLDEPASHSTSIPVVSGANAFEEQVRLISALAPGFHRSIYRHVLRFEEHFGKRLRPEMASWDYFQLEQEINRQQDELLGPLPYLSPAKYVAFRMARTRITVQKNLWRKMYQHQTFQAGLITLAALQSYRQRHGGYPDNPAVALKEIGCLVPLDLVTGKPIGYRLEKEGPVWWMPGPDGKDDGGQIPYTEADYSGNSPGKDILFRIGQGPQMMF
ncbi:MAG: serine/threonine protein kinase [Blastocatellia bacterium]|nr:serine/threonine protein kinase [Blastocatellia bacterium]